MTEAEAKLYFYRAELDRVVDGDTIDVLIDVGFNMFKKARLRVARIDAPEIRTRDKLEKAAGFATKEYVEKRIEENGGEMYVRTTEKGKYGRWLAEIYLGSPGIYNAVYNLSDELVSKGLAKEVDY